jgi:flagellar FliL protein
MVKEDTTEMESAKEGENEKSQKGKSSKKLITILIAAVVLGGGGFYAWNSGLIKGLTKEKKQALAAPDAQKKIEIGPIRSLDTFIVNLADPLGKRYLKVKMDLELTDDKVLPEIEKRLPQLKDTILTTLSSKNYDDISSFDGKMQLRAEMMAMLNQFLKTGRITSIYFTEFIVQ